MLFEEKYGNSVSYNNINSEQCCKESKDYLEKIWNIYKDYAPKDFQKKISTHDDATFNAVIWEMILGCRLLKNGFKLEQIDSDDRPDICIKTPTHRIWLECYLPSPPNKDSLLTNITTHESNKGTKSKSGGVNSDQNIACCTSGIYKKCAPIPKSQYSKWQEKNIINENDIFILAINGKNTHIHALLPDVAKIAYPIGQEYCELNRDAQIINRGYIYQEEIKKRNKDGKKTSINKCFFTNNNYSHLTGILYSKEWLDRVKSSINYKEPYIYLPNIYAKNQLNLNISSFAETIKIIEDETGYSLS